MDFLIEITGSYSKARSFMAGYTMYKPDEKPDIILNFDTNKQELYECKDNLLEYDYYHEYMWNRGLNQDIVDFFEVGYDMKTSSVTFPVRDKQGKLILVQKRSVAGKRFDNGGKSRKGTVLYGEYQAYRVMKKRMVSEIWVTESPIDCLTAWGNKQVALATMGANITSMQMNILNKLPCRSLVLALDNDEAGLRAINQIARVIRNKIIYVASYPDGIKDLNQALLEGELDNIKKDLYFFKKHLTY